LCLAFWGAPIPNDRQAPDCVRAAIDAQRAIYRLNLRRAAENQHRERQNAARAAAGQPPLAMLNCWRWDPESTRARHGGIVGSDEHSLSYTVLGREVNLASRAGGRFGAGPHHHQRDDLSGASTAGPELASTCTELPPQEVKGFREAVKRRARVGSPARTRLAGSNS